MQTKIEVEQITLFDVDTSFGRTCREASLQGEMKTETLKKEQTSKPSSRKSSKSQTRTLPMCLFLKGGVWAKQGSLCGVGENGVPFSVAWKLHDAQYYGVPQRRKRVCVLADFNGLTAAGILLDPQLERETEDRQPYSIIGSLGTGDGREIQPVSESVSGDIAQSFEEGQGTAGDFEGGIGSTSCGVKPELAKKTAYGFDQGTDRDVGKLFLKECAKTIVNGTNPGYHNAVCIEENE